MKLIDKIKNYFCDEEDEDVSKKNIPTKTEKPILKMGLESREDKREASNTNDSNLNAMSERELFRTDPTFNFPIIFDDEDFKEKEAKKERINAPKPVQTKTVEKAEIKIFKPSPNISPIYGIIDNDSKKGANTATSDNLLNLYDENKKIDIDDVLGKVFDQKRVEIKRENYEEVKDNSKSDMSFDFFNNIDTVTKEEIKTTVKFDNDNVNTIDEKLKTIDELLENTEEEDFYSLVDSMYKENNEEGDN